MKRLLLLMGAVLTIAGCKPAEKSKSEQLGKEIADKIRAPIEETQGITEKVQKTREMPPME